MSRHKAKRKTAFTPLGVKLTDEQMAAAEVLCQLHKQIQTLGGLAGTGKTTLISYLAQHLRNFACCSFTGKAAEVLRCKGVEATTVHSLIYIPIEKGLNGSPVFMQKDSLDGVKGIIVDEASMIGPSLYNDIVSYNLPVVFVGDHGQLEPVGEDIHLMKSPDFKLETVHRNAGDIALFAHHLRDGKEASSFRGSPLIKVLQKNDCVPYLLEMDQIICAKNETRVDVNRYIRHLRGEKDDYPVKGDRLISLMNSSKLGIYNGSQGVVRSVSPSRMSVCFNDRTIKIGYNVNTFNQEKTVRDILGAHPLDYAYTITAHKSQGSEWDKVLVLEQKCDLWDHKRWAYTAASRARNQLIWVLPAS